MKPILLSVSVLEKMNSLKKSMEKRYERSLDYSDVIRIVLSKIDKEKFEELLKSVQNFKNEEKTLRYLDKDVVEKINELRLEMSGRLLRSFNNNMIVVGILNYYEKYVEGVDA